MSSWRLLSTPSLDGATNMASWRLLSTPPLDGATNMAVDVALLRRARHTGESVFRVYSWSPPTLSLGRNQVAIGAYDEAQLETRGIDIVRRPTGGRAILHSREVTYSVTSPTNGFPLSECYDAINRVLLDALLGLGVTVRLAAPRARNPEPDALPCFAEPSTGEIEVPTDAGGAKLVGSAQYRENGAFLQHGSILLHDDQALLAEIARGSMRAAHPATLSSVLGREVTHDEVAQSLFRSVRNCVDRAARTLEFAEMREQSNAQVGFFRNPLWTWRR